MVACRAHNPEVVGSSPTPATKKFWRRSLVGPERPVHTRQVGGSNPPAATKILWLHGQEVKTSPFQGGIASSILAGVTKQDKGEPVSIRRRIRLCFCLEKVGEINLNRRFHGLRVSIFRLYIDEIDFIRKIW